MNEKAACAGDAPLVVDWPAHRRAELEATLRSGGVLLASYDCRTLRVLPDCRVPRGSYAFQPVSLKEDVVRMNDADSIRARLPSLGPKLAADLEASLARGSTLDLGLAMTGRWTTSVSEVFTDPKGFAPACRSATHFVRSVPVGAFAMSVGTKAKARAVAEVFDAGVRGESESARVHDARDGDLAACRAEVAGPGAAPPLGCSAPLRVELQKIDPRTEARAHCEDEGRMRDCGSWSNLVFDREIDDTQVAPLVAKLVALCKAGEVGACTLARIDVELYARATNKPPIADLDALEERGCALGDENACASQGTRYAKAGDLDKAFDAWKHTCRSKGVACESLAELLEQGYGPKDPNEHRQLLADTVGRACERSSSACRRYGALYKSGLRARGEFATLRESAQKCEAAAKPSDVGLSAFCLLGSYAYGYGLGVPRDLGRAKKLHARYCQHPDRIRMADGAACTFPKELE